MQKNNEITIQIPAFIYGIMKNYETQTGINITHQILESVYRQFFLKGLITVKDIRNND